MINHRNLVYKLSNYKLNCENKNKNQIIEKLKFIYENQITKIRTKTKEIFNLYLTTIF